MQQTKIFSKEKFDHFLSENVTRKEIQILTDEIGERIEEILVILSSYNKPTIRIPNGFWWCYENNFSWDKNTTHIDLMGSTTLLEPYETLRYETLRIPIHWLWSENFIDEYIKEVEAVIREKKKRKEAARNKTKKWKEDAAHFRKVIEGKLTKEELKYIKFK